MSVDIFAIDPGTTASGFVFYAGGVVARSGVSSNEEVLQIVKEGKAGTLAIEMIASYGMPVGKETFETVLWIGRFIQAWRYPDQVRLVYRKDVKICLCGSMKAKDANIRQSLIDNLGAPGVKKNPGPTYGVTSHAWSALAVAYTCQKQMQGLA